MDLLQLDINQCEFIKLFKITNLDSLLYEFYVSDSIYPIN